MEINKKKAGIVIGAVSGALLVGGGALAFADANILTPGDGPVFTGTIQAPAENDTEAADGSPEEMAQDQADTDALAKLATVTKQAATRAATDLVPGTISRVHLDDEDGFVVWEVDILKADGTMAEVLIDAGDTGNTVLEVEDADEVADADIAGTVTAPAEADDEIGAADGSPEEKAQDQAETAALAKLATVTEQGATKAATDAVPGTVTTIELGDEDGFVVWEVEVTKADGTVVEVLVDAGDASILAQETD